jgi:UDPglucose 6-dehydrogenase
MMKITVIGAGYVGLVTAACLADTGNEVMCVEKVSEKLATLKKGESPIYEPGLSEVLKKNIASGNIIFTDNIEEGAKFAEAIFLCVGTPQSDTGKADLSQVEEAARQIAEVSHGYKLVIEKSTVPVNTHKKVKMTLNRYANPTVQFDVASNPEFLREGSALFDFTQPDRIVVGAESERAADIFREIYRPFTDKGFPLLITTPAAAELIKHASNSFLALKISYINMVADLCEKVGADIELVAEGMGFDKRIGRAFLNAGLGYGGSCFPKDVKAFINMADENGVDFTMLEEADCINAHRRVKFLQKIEDLLWITKDKKICVWGLAFKPNTDDIREAPAIDLVRELAESGANLRLCDPKAADNFKKLFPEGGNIQYYEDMFEAAKDADAILLVTEWKEFVEADIEKIKKLMHLPLIIDGRNAFDPKKMKEAGVEYYSIGR